MFASFNALAKTQGCKDWLLNFKRKWNLDIGSLPHRPSGEPPEIKNKAPTGKPFAASFLTSNWNNLEEDIEKSGGSFFGTKIGSKNENQNWFSTYGLVKGGTKHGSIFGTKIASKNRTSFVFSVKKLKPATKKNQKTKSDFSSSGSRICAATRFIMELSTCSTCMKYNCYDGICPPALGVQLISKFETTQCFNNIFVDDANKGK